MGYRPGAKGYKPGMREWGINCIDPEVGFLRWSIDCWCGVSQWHKTIEGAMADLREYLEADKTANACGILYRLEFREPNGWERFCKKKGKK